MIYNGFISCFRGILNQAKHPTWLCNLNHLDLRWHKFCTKHGTFVGAGSFPAIFSNFFVNVDMSKCEYYTIVYLFVWHLDGQRCKLTYILIKMKAPAKVCLSWGIVFNTLSIVQWNLFLFWKVICGLKYWIYCI